MKECSVDGCDRKHEAKGYCNAHYRQYIKYGRILSKKTREKNNNQGCKVDGCDRKHEAKGYCNAHYKQYIKYGKILSKKIREKNNNNQGCKVDGCDRKHRCKGYCNTHYNQYIKYGKITHKKINLTNYRQGCKVDGCDRNHKSKGYCNVHYRQFKRYGKITSKEIQKYITSTCKVDGCDRKHEAKGYCKAHYNQYIKYGRIKSKKIRIIGKIIKCKIDGCDRNHKSKGYCNAHYQSFILDKTQIIKKYFKNKSWHYNTKGKHHATLKMIKKVSLYYDDPVNLLSMPEFGREIYYYQKLHGLNIPYSLGIERDAKTYRKMSYVLRNYFKGMQMKRVSDIDDFIMKSKKLKFDVTHLDYQGPMIQSHVDAALKMADNDSLVFVTVQEKFRWKDSEMDYEYGNFPIDNDEIKQIMYHQYEGMNKKKMAVYGLKKE